MKRLISLFLSVVLCASLFACKKEEEKAEAEEATTAEVVKVEIDAPEKWTPEPEVEIDDSGESTVTPLFYKATDGEGNVVWLFGSIHIGREDFYPLPDYVMNAFNSADALAVEFDIVAFEEDEEALTDMVLMLMYDDGTTIRDHVDPEIYESAVEILKENNSYISYYDYFIASFWAELIDSLVYEEVGVYDMPDGIDEYLIGKAYKQNKPVLDVESAEYQYGMLADYCEELQEVLLYSAVDTYKNYDREQYLADLDLMLDLWAGGEGGALAEYLSEEVEFESEEEKRLYEEYNNAMTTVRNLNMADYAEEALLSGEEIFICVGAAHIVGEGALVDLLTERGYTVEQVK